MVTPTEKASRQATKWEDSYDFDALAWRYTNVNNGTVDTNNDTITPLLSGQTFTGTATDITDYSSIGLMVYTDVNSANDGLVVEYSFDGTELEHNQFGAGKAFGGEVNRTDEWVLKNNTTYRVIIITQ